MYYTENLLDLTKRELLLQNFKIYKNTIHNSQVLKSQITQG